MCIGAVSSVYDSSMTQEISTSRPITPTRGLRVWGRVGVTGFLAVALPGLGGLLLLASLGEVGPWLASHGMAGVLMYVAGVALFAGAALLPTFALAALGGWTFGVGVGFVLAWLGIVAASAVGYVIAGRLCGGDLEHVFERRPLWVAAYRALIEAGPWRTAWLVALLRLAPNMPFAGSNVLFTAAGVSWFSYLMGTALGMAPRTLAAVWIAAGASQLSLDHPYGVWFLATSVVVLVVAMVVVSRIARRAVRQAVEEHRIADNSG